MVDSSVSVAQPFVSGERSTPSSARVHCEILPVACGAEGRIVALARPATVTAPVPGWWQELPAGRHPTQVVVEALSRELGGVFDQSRSVVHSTSWRYEGKLLVLSYLAALPKLASAPPGFTLQPVRSRSAGPSRTGDPDAVPVMDVLTHGLHHLAMLRISDPMVADSLAQCWHELLVDWHPLPAGLLEHCLPGGVASGGVAGGDGACSVRR